MKNIEKGTSFNAIEILYRDNERNSFRSYRNDGKALLNILYRNTNSSIMTEWHERETTLFRLFAVIMVQSIFHRRLSKTKEDRNDKREGQTTNYDTRRGLDAPHLITIRVSWFERSSGGRVVGGCWNQEPPINWLIRWYGTRVRLRNMIWIIGFWRHLRPKCQVFLTQ